MLSLHQLRCFLAAYENGSLTAAAAQLGYAQPTLSEQVRLLERTLDTPLFLRRGRGIAPTPAADVLRLYAERALAAVDEAERAIGSVTRLESGTVRFGVFGAAHLFIEADLIHDVLQQHPGLRIEVIGRSSAEALDALRRGHIEAAIVALPVPHNDLAVRPLGRFEHVYISSNPAHVTHPVTAQRLTEASLILPLSRSKEHDTYRLSLAERAQDLGKPLGIRVEVDDVRTAIDLVSRGDGDSVVPRVLLDLPMPGVRSALHSVSLDPPLYDTVAIVHRRDARLSTGSRLMIDLATKRIHDLLDTIADG
ncbi:LysR family transcriptional regulator [Amycolatopsis jejuensis]|uniref:LysR family transcriptional regulator n=1 Tax=Amycolatopsis jejuensis TaxID=330084 RepID=UPI000527DD4F|nr:LysR family transcriptional regulator [Amycolatopsis jejuensis]